MVAKTGVAKKVAVVKTTKSSSNVKKATISYEDMLKGFNTIPRKAETGKEKRAIRSYPENKYFLGTDYTGFTLFYSCFMITTIFKTVKSV